MDRIIKHNKIITSILGVLLTFSSIILSVPNTYASDVVVNATPTGSGLTCMTWVNPVNVSAPTCNAIQNTNADLTGSVEGINATIAGTYYTDSVIELSFTFYRVSNNTSLHSIVNGVRQDNSVDTGWDMIGYDYSDLDTNTGKLTLLFKHRVNSGNFNARLRGDYGTLLFALMPSDRVVGINYTIYAITDANAGSQQIINAINSQPNYTQNLNTINNNIQNVQDSVDDLSQTQQDIYDDEKDTINQNGDDASDLWNGTTFSLSFTDPFTTFWNLFTDAKCVDITTLANLVNAPQISTVCSPYPDGVKEIFSPCFNLFAVFFAVFFFIRWLSDSNGFTSIPDTSEASISPVARDDWYDRHGYKR